VIKYFGPLVSGYLDPTGRNFETVVYQAGKVITPEELNLTQERQTRGQSGWIADDFTKTTHVPWVVPTTDSDSLQTQPLQAIVNGWFLDVTNSGVVGDNSVPLGAGPAGAGTKRTDLVVLEVWRRLLGPAPSSDGKSFTGRIWANGNVRVSAADDLAVNYPDDILDVNVGAESTKRVQVQYRLRVIQGVDVFAYPSGLDDPVVVAHTVPAAPAAPDGVASLFSFVRSTSDRGLWVAGDGIPSNGLGTVDGYVYAIPLCAVFRRNTTAFDRNTNHNGGVAFPGPSDRPDGLLSDIIDPEDVADIRTSALPMSSDLLQKVAGQLLDNEVRTSYSATTSIGGGCAGHTVLYANEIGISNANGGDGITTGDTPGAEFIGQFDASRRRFSDRAVYEVVTAVISPGAWNDGDTVSIDPTNLTIYPYAAFSWAAYNSADVRIVDIVDARWLGQAPAKISVLNALDYAYYVTGLGANPLSSIDIKFNTISGLGLTDESLFVDVLIAYPHGSGLTKTPVADFGAASVSVNNPGQLPALPPVDFSALTQAFDYPHREVLLQYTTLTQSATLQSDNNGLASYFRLPERADSIVSVQVNAAPIVGTVSLDTSGRQVTFNNPLDYTSPGDTIAVDYVALRALPQNDEQVTVYYWARAPQTVESSLLGLSLAVEPVIASSAATAIVCGSGSQGVGYPYETAFTQAGGVYPTSASSFFGEHELAATGGFDIANFYAAVGQGQVPVVVPCATSTEWTFQRALVDADIEGRSFFKSVPPGYVPGFFASEFDTPKRHRALLPVIVSLSADTSFGCKGQRFLLLLVNDIAFGSNNSAGFNSDLTQNRTTAALFRIKGNPIAH
jgi:hypothetical protein